MYRNRLYFGIKYGPYLGALELKGLSVPDPVLVNVLRVFLQEGRRNLRILQGFCV